MKSHERLAVDGDSHVHVFRWAPPAPARAVIVFSHGFLVPGFESHRLFLALAGDAVERGFEAVLFDYRGSGYSDLSFSEMTLDTEIADLHTVVEHAGAGRPVFVWGQSLGSVVAAHVVARRHDVSGVVLWALSARTYQRFVDRPGFRELAEGADTAYLDAGFEVGRQFLESLRDKDTYDALAGTDIPKLFVHGDADDKAPVELSREGYRHANEPKELVEIPGGNHAFKAQPDLLREAKEASFGWIVSQLRER
jgi:pimeloyl-ACP methyl ester carboxylesterase